MGAKYLKTAGSKLGSYKFLQNVFARTENRSTFIKLTKVHRGAFWKEKRPRSTVIGLSGTLSSKSSKKDTVSFVVKEPCPVVESQLIHFFLRGAYWSCIFSLFIWRAKVWNLAICSFFSLVFSLFLLLAQKCVFFFLSVSRWHKKIDGQFRSLI